MDSFYDMTLRGKEIKYLQEVYVIIDILHTTKDGKLAVLLTKKYGLDTRPVYYKEIDMPE